MMWSEMRKQKQNKKLISHRDFKKDYLRLAMQIWPNWICIWCRFYFEFFRNKNLRLNLFFFKLYFQRVVLYCFQDKGLLVFVKYTCYWDWEYHKNRINEGILEIPTEFTDLIFNERKFKQTEYSFSSSIIKFC